MSERSACGKGVGCGAGRGGYDATICLDDGEKLGVAVQFEVGNIWGRAAVYDKFVEHFELLAFDCFVAD